MRYDPIHPDLFRQNRQRFARKMQPESLAIFYSNDRAYRSGDVTYPFRQNSDLFYLSGIDQEHTVLVLFPDCLKEGFREILFIQRSDRFVDTWQGPRMSQEQARTISGISRVFWVDDMEVIIHELILLAKRIYLNLQEQDHREPGLDDRTARQAGRLMQRYPAHKYHRAQPILRKLRSQKAPVEIALLQQAIAITQGGFHEVFQTLRPGIGEHEIEAAVTGSFIRHRANGHAYPPIIASGPRSCILHYTNNNQMCSDGDLLLLDIGAEYANYASDITRTLPVSGQFTDRQREVYNAVYRILMEAQQMLVPGILLEEFETEVGKLMNAALKDLGLLTQKEIEQSGGEYPAYKRYFMHRCTHHIGLDVHDPANRYNPVQAGMVISCEPGIYIREEAIGVRLENNILVTDQGPVNLSADIPIESEEIEERLQAALIS